MPIHESVGKLFERRGEPQKAIAMEWLQQWKEANPNEPVSETTIQPRLSELLKGKAKGIKFFFEAPAKAALLLRLLGANDAERAAIDIEARSFLKDGGKLPVRLVIDVAGLTEDALESTTLFTSLDEHFLCHPEWQRVTLLVTRAQHLALPRPFDEDYVEKGTLTVERIEDVAAAERRAQALNGKGTVVLTHRRRRDPSTWIAVARSQGGFSFHPDPAAARSAMARDGKMPAPTPPHTLQEAGVEGASFRVTIDPFEMRRLMDALVDETKVSTLKLNAEQRRWLGDQLGVPACSTPHERASWAAKRVAGILNTKVESGSSEAVESLCERASRRPVMDRVLLAGHEVHVVNPSSEIVPAGHEAVIVHKINRRPSALSLVLEATQGWTTEDYLADPLLEGLRSRLVEEGASADEVDHALAGLLHTGALEACPDAFEEDWRPRLLTLLAADPPPAHIQVTTRPWTGGNGVTSYERPVRRDDGSIEAEPAFVAPGPSDAIVTRDMSLSCRSWTLEDERYSSYISAATTFMPRRAAQARDEAWMLDAFEATQAVREGDDMSDYRHMLPEESCRVRDKPSEPASVELAPIAWRWADEMIALVWMMLRGALRRTAPMRLHDGRSLLALGGGWVATIRARRSPISSATPSAAIHAVTPTSKPQTIPTAVDDLRFVEPSGYLADLLRAWALVRNVDSSLARVGSYFPGNDIPGRITIRGLGLAVDVGLSTSPFAHAGNAFSCPEEELADCNDGAEADDAYDY